MWVDDDAVLDLRTRKTTLDDDSAYQLHVGLYSNGWHDDGEILGSQTYRQVWYDEIVIGTELSDVQIDKTEAAYEPINRAR
jgi:hypothetical protein